MGFREDDVLSMPLDKVQLYVEGAVRTVNTRRKETFSDLVNAIGVALSGKGFDTYLKDLGD